MWVVSCRSRLVSRLLCIVSCRLGVVRRFCCVRCFVGPVAAYVQLLSWDVCGELGFADFVDLFHGGLTLLSVQALCVLESRSCCTVCVCVSVVCACADAVGGGCGSVRVTCPRLPLPTSRNRSSSRSVCPTALPSLPWRPDLGAQTPDS